MINRLEIITDVPSLRSKAQKVSKWSGERIGIKLNTFILSNHIPCIGLAAPQVGINKRVFILHDANREESAIFINPKIVERGSMEEEAVEGCLSIPGRQFKVKRATSIIVKDAVRIQSFELTGITARAWLHELDHLNGILISDIGTEVFDDANISLM